MTVSTSPFDLMYDSFELFAHAAGTRKGPLIELSSGVNWARACPSVIASLQMELESALTYRPYGPSNGLGTVTDTLALVESTLNGGSYRPEVSVTNGAAEGAHLVFEMLTESGVTRRGDRALMIGHAYPLYDRLTTKFGLQYVECLRTHEEGCSYMPAVDQVVAEIQRVTPKLVFLVVPGNPVGETYSLSDLRRVCDACTNVGAHLLVDRVCLLPWDDQSPLAVAIAPLVESGQCVVVDSFSKSESLAGIRTGFIVSNISTRDHLLRLTRERCLNPIIFSTFTLALSRLSMLGEDTDHLCHDVFEQLLRECASADRSSPNGNATVGHFRRAYRQELTDRHQLVQENLAVTLARFDRTATRPMRLDAGFNVALTLPAMRPANEAADQRCLAYDYGVAVLTERCFRTSARQYGNYFLRLSLASPRPAFHAGLEALCSYINAM